jgi:hypothetical protein
MKFTTFAASVAATRLNQDGQGPTYNSPFTIVKNVLNFKKKCVRKGMDMSDFDFWRNYTKT